MKKTLLLIITITLSLFASAQTQQGYVKTKGRLDKKGEPLGGVIVRAKGEHNNMVSSDDGTFSLNLVGLKVGDAYSLQRVQKNGYELNEPDIIGREFAFSDKVRLEIVMVSTAELQAEKQRIEDIAYKTAEKNYKTKYKQLETMVNENRISTDQYRKQLADLQDKFEKYQLLIDGLAEHYAHTDYDALDEKDREINFCIENGELERADSLIRSIFDPTSALESNMAALARLNQQIDQAYDIIAQANDDMAAVLRQQERDAEFFFYLYTIALLKFDNEKAESYIESRALLDTTNIVWQTDAGVFFQNYRADYDKAMVYFRRAFALSMKQYESTNDMTIVAYCNMSSICFAKQMFAEGVEYGNEAIDLIKESDCNILGLIPALNNIGVNSMYLGHYAESLDYFNAALDIVISTIGDDNEEAANLYNNIAGIYSVTGDYYKAYNNYLRALSIRENVLTENHYLVGQSYNNLGDIYLKIGRTDEAIEHFRKGLRIRTLVLGEIHPDVAESYSNLGYALIQKQNLDDASKHLLTALSLFDRMQLKDVRTAKCLSNLGILSYYRRNFDTALDYCEQALEIYEQLLPSPHPDIATIYFNMGMVYSYQHLYVQSISCFDTALSMFEKVYDRSHPSFSTIYTQLWPFYNDYGNKLSDEGQFQEAITYYEKALDICVNKLHSKESVINTIRENIEMAKKQIVK